MKRETGKKTQTWRKKLKKSGDSKFRQTRTRCAKPKNLRRQRSRERNKQVGGRSSDFPITCNKVSKISMRNSCVGKDVKIHTAKLRRRELRKGKKKAKDRIQKVSNAREIRGRNKQSLWDAEKKSTIKSVAHQKGTVELDDYSTTPSKKGGKFPGGQKVPW